MLLFITAFSRKFCDYFNASSLRELLLHPPYFFLCSCHRPEEITAAFKALEDAQRTLREQCNKAMEIQAETSALEELSMKERWRIPIVVARIAKNRRLSTADSRIWAAISRNMTSEEAVEKLTRTTLRPPVSRPALSGPGAHASGQSPRTAGTHSTNNVPSTIIGRVFAMRSNRLFAPTVSSQNRFSAEETKTKGKPLRKYFERAHKPQAASPAHAQTARATIPNSLHKTSQRTTHTDTHPGTPITSPATVKTAKKAHRRKHKSRHRSPTHKTAQEEQKGEDFDPEEEDENEATLVDHISAGLVSFAATLSSKFTRSAKVHSASADEADSVTQTSLTVAGGKKQIGGSLTFRETDEVVEVVVEGKEALPPHMVSQKAHQKGASVDTGEGALAAAMEKKQHSQSDATGGHGFEEEKSESTMGPPSPSKSRAFFGPFLASLSRKNTHPHPAPSTSPGKGLDASRNVAGDVANDPPGSQSTHSSQNSPKPSPMRSLGSLGNFFGGTLGRLMPWSAASPNNNNNQVIPVQ